MELAKHTSRVLFRMYFTIMSTKGSKGAKILATGRAGKSGRGNGGGGAR